MNSGCFDLKEKAVRLQEVNQTCCLSLQYNKKPLTLTPYCIVSMFQHKPELKHLRDADSVLQLHNDSHVELCARPKFFVCCSDVIGILFCVTVLLLWALIAHVQVTN